MDFSNSGDVLQAYREATDVAAKAKNADEEIAAYRKVIELGNQRRQIAADEQLKHNMIMYWSYNNVADALLSKSFKNAVEGGDNEKYKESLKYYKLGLKFARDNLEKISVLNRMADSYKHLGDEEHLMKVKQKVISNLKAEDKRRAYNDLADSLSKPRFAAKMFEEALNYVNDEKVSLNEKCENTLRICDKLLTIYDRRQDKKDYQRILRLKGNTENLQKTCINKGGCSF